MILNLHGLAAILIYTAAAFAVSLCVTIACIHILPYLGYMDQPGGRRAHIRPVPRGGGIAFILAFFLVGLLYTYGGISTPVESARASSMFFSIILPGLIIVITGLIDDRIELKSHFKLLAQITAAMVIFYSGNGIHSLLDYVLPAYITLPATVLWVVGLVNAFNLIDGLDGVAAGLASIASLCIATWCIFIGGSIHVVVFLMIFCGACLGFLRYNFSPAKIFMGDTGSMFIGLFFAVISMNQVSKSITFTSLLVPLLALGVPIFDVLLAIWRRVIRKLNDPESGVKIMTGDSEHLHHRIMQKEKSQTKTALLIYLIAIGLAAVAMICLLIGTTLPALTYLLLLFAIGYAIRLANIELLDSFRFVVNGLKKTRKSIILVAVHPIIDSILVCMAYFIAMYLLISNHQDAFTMPSLLSMLAPFPVLLCLSGIYKTFWLRAGINRYYLLVKRLLLASLISFSIVYTLYIHGILFEGLAFQEVVATFMLFAMLAFLLIGGERFVVRYLESFGLRQFYLKATAVENMPKTVIFGGGLSCRIYLHTLFTHYHMYYPLVIIGIIDDDPVLRNLNVYGFQVIGNSEELEQLYAKRRFDNFVITTHNISRPVFEKIESFCNQNQIRLSYFIFEEFPADSPMFSALVEKRIKPASNSAQ